MTKPTPEQYIELYNLLFNEDVDIKFYKENGIEELVEEDTMPQIVEELTKHEYNGDYSYQSMYRFIKGLKNNKPTITPKEEPNYHFRQVSAASLWRIAKPFPLRIQTRRN